MLESEGVGGEEKVREWGLLFVLVMLLFVFAFCFLLFAFCFLLFG